MTNSPEHGTNRAHHRLKLGWLHIDRKVDIVAFAALLLALSTLLTQIFWFVQGPKIEMFPTEQLLIMRKQKADEKYYVHFVGTMTYANAAGPGFNAVIHREEIEFELLNNRRYEYGWYRHVSTDHQKFDNKELDILKTGDAKPFTVIGGESTSHETEFAPKSAENFLLWDRFLEEAEDVGKIKFRIRAEIFEKKRPIIYECDVVFDEDLILHLRDKYYSAPLCLNPKVL